MENEYLKAAELCAANGPVEVYNMSHAKFMAMNRVFNDRRGLWGALGRDHVCLALCLMAATGTEFT